MDKFNALYNKVSKEFEDYKADLFYQTPKDIFDASYRTSCYQEFLCLFENDHDWSDEEFEVFFNEENLLGTLYSEWLDCDSDIQNEFFRKHKKLAGTDASSRNRGRLRNG